MPIYEIEKDGKQYEVDAPDQQTALTAFGGESSPKPEAPSIPMLPGRDRVEQMIAQRQNPLAALLPPKRTPMGVISNTMGNLATMGNPMASLLRGQIGRQGQATALPQQLVEAGVANIGLDYQAGKPMEAFDSFMKGIKGERMGQVGDIIRSVAPKGKEGLYEIPAMAIGLVAAVGPADIATKGLVSRFVKNSAAALADVARPELMTPAWRLKRAQMTNDSVDDAIKIVRSKYQQFYDANGSLPVKTDGGTTTVATIKKILDEIQKEIPDITWGKREKLLANRPNMEGKITAYFETKQLLRDSLPEKARKAFDALNAESAPIYRAAKVLKKMVMDETGKARKTAPLETASKDPGRRQMMEEFANLNTGLKKVITDMDKYTSRQRMKKTAGQVAKAGAVLAGAGFGGHYVIDAIKDYFNQK